MQIATSPSQRRANFGWLPDLAWAIGRELLLVTAIQLVVFSALVVISLFGGAVPPRAAQVSSGFYVYVLFKAVQSFRASRPATRP